MIQLEIQAQSSSRSRELLETLWTHIAGHIESLQREVGMPAMTGQPSIPRFGVSLAPKRGEHRAQPSP